MDCRTPTVFSSILHLTFRASTSFLRPSVIETSAPLVRSACHQQSVEQDLQLTYAALPPDLDLPGGICQIFFLRSQHQHPVNAPSGAVFLWPCILPQPPLGCECLRDYHPPKKRDDASSLCCATRCPHVLHCLLGMQLPNCLEGHCPPPLSRLEGKIQCTLGSQLPTH